MNRKALSLILILAMLTLSVLPGWSGHSRSIASIAPPGADLYIKDTPLDSGVEPNPDGGPMRSSVPVHFEVKGQRSNH